MRFYHDLITKKSWQVLQKLKKEFDFVLIGGWAVWLYTKSLKSKDIDIIVGFDQLESFRKKYDLFKNSRLKKYEAKVEEASIDIYVPFYSELGVPAERIEEEVEVLGTFKVPKKEVLLILKQKAYSARKLSIKGRKDFIDMVSLVLMPDFDWGLYYKLIKRYRLIDYIKELEKLIGGTTEIGELNLNRHKFSRLKKGLLEKIEGCRR